MCAAGYASHGGKRDFSQAVQGHCEYPASESISNGVMYLVADWQPTGLDLFDTDFWSQPLVHDSASPEIMAGEHVAVNPSPTIVRRVWTLLLITTTAVLLQARLLMTSFCMHGLHIETRCVTISQQAEASSND